MSRLTRLYKKPEIRDSSRRRERGANYHVVLDAAGRIDCRALHEEIADQLIVDARFN
jgi:hypothetical protein